MLISVRVFDSADEALASNEIAATWMRENVLEFVKGMPEINGRQRSGRCPEQVVNSPSACSASA